MPSPITYVSLQEAKRPLYFGVDVGGTSTKIGLVDDNGSSIDLKEFDENNDHQTVAKIVTEREPKDATTAMARELHRLLDKHSLSVKDIAGVGLGIPGTMDVKKQCLRRPPNLPEWDGFPICNELTKESQMPVVFCNDANAAAFGEYWVGSAKGESSIALLTLGTGIGCGIIIDGKTVGGAIGYGGECGHIIVDIDENAKICGCGQRGHLEIYASATGVARRTIALTDTKKSSLRSKITPETKLGEIPKMVGEEAKNGDAVALEIIQEAARYLGIGIVSLLNTIDPSCVLLGGAMTFGGKGSPIGDQYLAWVRDEINTRGFQAIAEAVRLDFAVLGGDAGYIGAAGHARKVMGDK